MRAPSRILHLLLDEFPKVNPFVEGVCFSAGIADPTFRIKVFGNLDYASATVGIAEARNSYLHHSLTVHPQKQATELL